VRIAEKGKNLGTKFNNIVKLQNSGIPEFIAAVDGWQIKT
jgi:hypothetical protein